jgi:hypothetical protein
MSENAINQACHLFVQLYMARAPSGIGLSIGSASARNICVSMSFDCEVLEDLAPNLLSHSFKHLFPSAILVNCYNVGARYSSKLDRFRIGQYLRRCCTRVLIALSLVKETHRDGVSVLCPPQVTFLHSRKPAVEAPMLHPSVRTTLSPMFSVGCVQLNAHALMHWAFQLCLSLCVCKMCTISVIVSVSVNVRVCANVKVSGDVSVRVGVSIV